MCLSTLSLRRPVATIIIALLVALIAAALVSRLRADVSLGAMFSRNSDSARALQSVVTNFGAVDELLVLASIPPSQNEPEPQRLLAFAGRFEEQARKSPDLQRLSDGVLYRADAQTLDFFQKVLVPAGVFYLDDASFSAALERLTAPYMRRQIEQDQAMLAAPGPAAAAMAKAFMQDPLRLREFLMPRLAEQSPIKTYAGSDAFLSEDGRSVLIRIRGKEPPSNLDFCAALLRATTNAVNSANLDRLKIEYAGSYAIAAQSARAIRADMIASVIGSLICLQGLFLLAYRGAIRLFLVCLFPIALGALLGFAAFSVFSTQVSPLSAVLGGVLAGMAIDYSIQYLSCYQTRRQAGDDPRAAAQDAVRAITPAALAACITSLLGFAAIGASSVKMLQEFSLLGSLGLAGAFLATVLVLPPLLVLFDKKGCQTPFLRREWSVISINSLLACSYGFRKTLITGCIAGMVLGAVFMLATRGIFSLETDLTVMHPRPNAALDAQTHLAKTFGIAPDSILIHLRAATPQGLVALAHRVDQRLRSESGRAMGIRATWGLATLLPDPAMANERMAQIGAARADRVVADFDQVMSDAGFNTDAPALANYAAFLRVLLTQAAVPCVSDLLLYPRLAETLLPRSALNGQPATEAITLVFFQQEFSDRAARDRAVVGVRAALAGIDGATPTGLSVIGYDAETTVRHDLPRLVGLATLAVMLYLALHFRSVPDTLLAMLPTVFSMIMLLAIARLAGQKLNLVNLVAIPLLIGIDVDYGVFLVSLTRVKRTRNMTLQDLLARLAPVCHAVAMCALATLIGFGSLAWTSVPAVRSLGFAVAVGIGACLFACLFLVVPIFFTLVKTLEDSRQLKSSSA